DGKLIGIDAIRAADNEITNDLLYLLLYRAYQQIGEGDDALVIDAKTQRWTAIVCLMPSALLRGEMATGAWIARAFRSVGCAGDAGNLRTRAVTRIHEVCI